MQPNGFDQRMKEVFSQIQLERLGKLRITSALQLCAFVAGSKDAINLLAGELQMSRDDLEKRISQLLDTLSPTDRESLRGFHPIEKGMGLRKKHKDNH
jgi:hypothetical protein